MSNVIAWDEGKLMLERKKMPAHKPTTRTFVDSVEIVGLGQQAETIVAKMAKIDCIEMLLIMERILKPHRRLK